MGLAAVVLLLWVGSAPRAQAATLSVDHPTVPEGGTVHITMAVDPTTAQSFNVGDKITVTNPNNCKYSTSGTAITPAMQTAAFDFPGSAFTLEGTATATCPSASNSDLAGTQNSAVYKVLYTPNPPASSNPSIPATTNQFKVTMTDGAVYQRGQRVAIAARGFPAGGLVSLQVDAPQQSAIYQDSLTADGSGAVSATYVVPKGTEDDRDVGNWVVKLAPITAGGSKVEDRQGFAVVHTRVLGGFDPATVPTSVARANPVQVSLLLVYEGSVGSPSPVRMTSSDIPGGQVDVLLKRTGTPAFQQTVNAAYDTATGLWRVKFNLPPNAPAGGGYTLNVSINQNDRYANPILGLATSSFTVTPVDVTPTFTLLTPQVERASAEHGLSAKVRLAYPSGDLVTVDDVKDATTNKDGLVFAELLRPDGTAIPGLTLQGLPAGSGVWEFKDQILPRDTPLGEARLHLTSTAVNPSASPTNHVDTAARSDPFTIVATHPRLTLSFVDKNGAPINGILRGGDPITLRAKVQYASGAAVGAADTRDGGRALLRIVPAGDLTKVIQADFQYDAANARWVSSYAPKVTDPVGAWTFVPLFSDTYGNANTTEATFQVGLRIATQLSSTVLNRSSDLTVTASMTLPGSTDPLPGSMNVTVTDPTGKAVVASPLAPVAGGRYTATLQLPNDVVLGTYQVVVRGASAKDQGQDVTPVQVGSAQIAVNGVGLTVASVERLGTAKVGFQLGYPNGGGILGPAQITPTVQFRTSAGAVEKLLVAYDTVTQVWSASYTPPLDAALGNGNFVLRGNDTVGNALPAFLTQPVRVDPAPLAVKSLATLRQQYLRGENVTVRALLAYSDGSVPKDLVVPLYLRLGELNVTRLELRYNAATSAFEGTARLPLDAGLSTPAKAWSAILGARTLTDANGNGGPATVATSPFSVGTALLTVRITDQPLRELGVGTTANVTFVVSTLAGERVTGSLPGLKVLVVRNGQVSNTTVQVTSVGDHYVANYPIPEGSLAGSYALRVGGVDRDGNPLTELDSNSFEVASAASKATPALGPGLAALALLGALLLARARKL